MDLSKATTVRKSSIQEQNFDLRFMHSSNRFQLSDNFYANKGMNTNGFTYHTLEVEGGEVIPLLSIQSNEDSVFYKGKEGDADKDTGFAYSVLLKGLREMGLISQDDDARFDNFELVNVGENDGATYYQIKPWEEDEEDTPEEAQADLTGATQEEATNEEVEEVEEVNEEEVIENDPFA